jgi:hypothetical protein
MLVELIPKEAPIDPESRHKPGHKEQAIPLLHLDLRVQLHIQETAVRIPDQLRKQNNLRVGNILKRLDMGHIDDPALAAIKGLDRQLVEAEVDH